MELDFEEICRQVKEESLTQSIGRLGEKTLHAALKRYFEPDTVLHEVKVGRYVADIHNESGITEIQTRDLGKLRNKLTAFLEEHPVTVVYPMPAKKWLIWIDGEGALSKPRKSPKAAIPAQCLVELYKLKPQFLHPNFRLCVVMLELEEYRLQNGWGNGGKRGSTRHDRIPLRLTSVHHFDCPADYAQLIPSQLAEPFTAKEFGKATGLPPKGASAAMTVLRTLDLVELTGKRKQAFLYCRRKKHGKEEKENGRV